MFYRFSRFPGKPDHENQANTLYSRSKWRALRPLFSKTLFHVGADPTNNVRNLLNAWTRAGLHLAMGMLSAVMQPCTTRSICWRMLRIRFANTCSHVSLGRGFKRHTAGTTHGFLASLSAYKHIAGPQLTPSLWWWFGL